MNTSNQRRIILIGADGLRPDLLNPKLMPTIAQLAETGIRFRDHHAVFPSHTRVNISSLASGSSPGRHGLVANTMIVPFASEDHIIDTSDYRHLDALELASRGQALLAPTLGDLLARRGERLAVAASSSPGACLLWTHRHRSRLINPNSAFGLADLYDLREKLGPVPEKVRGPQCDQLRYITRAATDIFLDDLQNRVIVLWFSEPDSSQHSFGLGAPEVATALQAVDACVGDLLIELERRGERDRFDIFFVSDHGHSTVTAHNTLRDYLAQAKAEIGLSLPPLVTASDFIYTAPGCDEPAVSEIQPLVEWLLAQPWVGVVFGGRRDIAILPGVVPLRRVWNDRLNERRPLLAISPCWSDEPNEAGVPGKVMTLTTQSALRSSHGSASPYDMHAVMIANGPSFREGVASFLPSGAVDLLPTILTLLEIPLPGSLDGRVLWEAFCRSDGEPGPAEEIILEPRFMGAAANPAQLAMWQVGRTTYLHGALQPGSSYVTGFQP